MGEGGGVGFDPDLLHLPPKSLAFSLTPSRPWQAHSPPPLWHPGFHPKPGVHQGLLGTERREAGILAAFTCCIQPALAGLELLSGIWLAANDQWALAIMIGLAAL